MYDCRGMTVGMYDCDMCECVGSKFSWGLFFNFLVYARSSFSFPGSFWEAYRSRGTPLR